MRPRSDGLHFPEEAVVIPDRCVSCGICAGACPSSTPFRSDAGYVSGIEMPSMLMGQLRAAMSDDLVKLKGEVRVMVFGCDNAANIGDLRSESVAVMSLPCIAILPPSFIEYALRNHQVDGVFITGCRENDCYHRLGVLLLKQRLTAEREPRLRRRPQHGPIRQCGAASTDSGELALELESFRSGLRNLARGKASAEKAELK